MKNRWLYILLGVLAFIVVLGIGGVIGGAVVYSRMRDQPGQVMYFEQPLPQMEVFEPARAFVTEVISDSPADQAGLEEGDLILAVDDESIGPQADLAEIIQQYEPGDTILLSVQRPGEAENLEIEVDLGENPDKAGQAYLGIGYTPSMPMAGRGRMPFYHYRHPGLDETLIFPRFSQRHLMEPAWVPEDVEQAVIIGKVLADTPAEQAGLAEGDFITALDGEAVGKPGAFAEKIQAHEAGDEITLTVYHQGEDTPEELQITLGEHPDKAGSAYLGVELGGYMLNRHEDSSFLKDMFNFELDIEKKFKTPEDDI
jgi:membrane-associated protease RseP (regulator of RpoE activity)